MSLYIANQQFDLLCITHGVHFHMRNAEQGTINLKKSVHRNNKI